MVKLKAEKNNQNRPINQSINHIDQSVLIDQSINQSINQSYRSVHPNRSINQSNSQALKLDRKISFPHFFFHRNAVKPPLNIETHSAWFVPLFSLHWPTIVGAEELEVITASRFLAAFVLSCTTIFTPVVSRRKHVVLKIMESFPKIPVPVVAGMGPLVGAVARACRDNSSSLASDIVCSKTRKNPPNQINFLHKNRKKFSDQKIRVKFRGHFVRTWTLTAANVEDMQ